MKAPLRLSPEFVTELEQVYASLGMEPEVDLHFLAEQFTAWRRRTQELLHEYSAGLSKYDPLLCPISLFRTMDYGRLETAHTRTLAWLLDPKKEHGFGDKLLAALLRRLDGAEQFDALRDLHLASEYPTEATGTKGRLDVLAEGEWVVGHSAPVRWVLAIEAKVDAEEGEVQLAKYEKWLRAYARGREVLRVFLTPEARTAASAGEDWQTLSYLDLVRIFRSVYDDLRDAPGFHFLRFYLAGVLQDICGFPRSLTPHSLTGDVPDPYAIVDYLKTAHESRTEDPSHDPAR